MKVFLDTNILASGFATRGLCSDLVREVLENHELFTSEGILLELKRTLTRKFKVPDPVIEEILDLMHSCAQLAAPDSQASYPIDDLDDIPHLSAAESENCHFFVTGDRELWKADPIQSMRVVSPREFWDAVRSDT